MKLDSRYLIPSTFMLLIAFGPCGAMATTLTVTPTAIYHVSGNGINVFADTPMLVTGSIDPNFQLAFDSWNNEPGNPKGWTLVNGGALDNDTLFDVSTYQAAISNATTGGVRIQIDYTPGTGAPPRLQSPCGPVPQPMPCNITAADAVWSQSILTTLKRPGSPPGNPYLDGVDNASGLTPPGQLDLPAYPYQFLDSAFYDHPARSPTNSWSAVTYLSQADYTTKQLKVYDGVHYGFMVVPEPPILALIVAGIALLLGQALRRGRQAV